MASVYVAPPVSIPVQENITSIDDDNIKRIVTFSDIHGDLHALIIALRDCAGVICKKRAFAFDPAIAPDTDLDRLLDINLNGLDIENYRNIDPTVYACDLNYEWCGSDTYVVIIGDLIDLFRVNISKKNPFGKQLSYEYTQVELKIIIFLNIMDSQAKAQRGRVIKLIGNHEMMNFFSTPAENAIIPYLTDDMKIKPYYISNKNQPVMRHEFFNFENIGFNLFMETKPTTILRINSNIFVHGQLSQDTFATHNELNRWLNEKKYVGKQDPSYVAIKELAFGYPMRKGDNHLWDREFGGEGNSIHERLSDKQKQQDFCDKVMKYVQRFCDGDDIKCMQNHKDDMRVIIGHCPQYLPNAENGYGSLNTTFTKITTYKFLDVLSPPAKTSVPRHISGNTFGITMECPHKKKPDDFHIYRVDIGVSRGFDNSVLTRHQMEANRKCNEILLPRVPQILEIHDNNVKIFRVTVAHSALHQPRPYWFDYNRSVPDSCNYVSRQVLANYDMQNDVYRKDLFLPQSSSLSSASISPASSLLPPVQLPQPPTPIPTHPIPTPLSSKSTSLPTQPTQLHPDDDSDNSDEDDNIPLVRSESSRNLLQGINLDGIKLSGISGGSGNNKSRYIKYKLLYSNLKQYMF